MEQLLLTHGAGIQLQAGAAKHRHHAHRQSSGGNLDAQLSSPPLPPPIAHQHGGRLVLQRGEISHGDEK